MNLLNRKEMKKQWYPVPPYNNEGWKIINEDGEHVAVFEDKEECIQTCKLHNHELSRTNAK